MKPKIAVLGFQGSIGRRHFTNLIANDIPARGWDTIGGAYRHDREEVIAWADGVIIATPTKSHMNDMIDCKGKHILVEKPMAFDAPAPMLRGFCKGKKSNGELVFVANNLRFHHCVKEVKKMLNGGLIGKIGWADFWVKQKTEKEPYLIDGVSRNWGAHEIDLALFLLGPGQAREVKDVRTVNDNDVAMNICLQHENGSASNISMDYLTDPEQRGFKLCGTKGTIEVDLVARTVKVSNLVINTVNQMKDSWDKNYVTEVLEFCHAVSEQEHHFLATGEEGAEVMDIILSVRSMAGLKDKEQ